MSTKKKPTLDGYSPRYVAKEKNYHIMTIRRWIRTKRIKAIDTNKGGKQPIWMISKVEFARIPSKPIGSKA